MSKEAKTEHSTKEHVHEFHAAFLKTAAMRAALYPMQLATMNISAQVALTSVMGALPGLSLYRSAIEEELPKFDIARFDRLRTLAQALSYAHMICVSASQPEDELQALQAEGFESRDTLLADAQALAQRKLLDKKPLEALKKGPGYLNMTEDLGARVTMIRGRWDVVKDNSGIKLADLDKAESLYERITTAYGNRQQIQQKVMAAQDDRQRAFTLLLEAYDDARRAISFLRWREGDLETIAPSLWAGRGSRGGSSSVTDEPGTAPGATPPGVTSTGTTAHAATDPAGPAPAAPHAAATVPNGNPFTN